MISSAVNIHDLRAAEKLARYRYSFLVRWFHERELWFALYVIAAIVLGNAIGRVHGEWQTVLLLSGMVITVLALRRLYRDFRFRQKAKRMSRDRTRYELTNDGLRFHMSNGSIRILGWEKILDARADDSVLLLYFRPSGKFKRQKYLLLPLQGLERAQRVDVVNFIPDRIRSQSVWTAMAGWKLS